MNVDEGDATEATGTCHARLRLSALSRESLDAVPVDVRAIRRHFAFPKAGRIVTNNAASTQPPDELLELYQSLGPGYENVHRGQSSASQAMTALFEELLRHDRAVPRRAGPRVYRAVQEHDRSHQRGHVLAADRVPRRRQRGDHDDGAQLQLRPLVRDVPGDPAPVRPAGGLPAGAVRPGHRRARPGPPGLADRRPHQAGVLPGRVEFPRHPHPAARSQRAGRRQRVPPAQRGTSGRTCWSTAHSWSQDRSPTCRPWTWTTWRSPSTRCWPRSASVCSTPSSTCARPRCRSCTAAT